MPNVSLTNKVLYGGDQCNYFTIKSQQFRQEQANNDTALDLNSIERPISMSDTITISVEGSNAQQINQEQADNNTALDLNSIERRDTIRAFIDSNIALARRAEEIIRIRDENQEPSLSVIGQTKKFLQYYVVLYKEA